MAKNMSNRGYIRDGELYGWWRDWAKIFLIALFWIFMFILVAGCIVITYEFGLAAVGPFLLFMYFLGQLLLPLATFVGRF